MSTLAYAGSTCLAALILVSPIAACWLGSRLTAARRRHEQQR